MKQGSTITLGSNQGGSTPLNGPTMVFRGDWSEYYEYGYQNCVTYRNGIGKGLYIAGDFIAKSDKSPTSNPKWVKIADLDTNATIITF